MAATASTARTRSILDFSSHLQVILSEPLLPSYEATFAELPNYLAVLPIPQSEISQHQRTQIKKHAVLLWNSCNKHNVATSDGSSNKKHVARVRALSFLLLESVIKPNAVDSSHRELKSREFKGHIILSSHHVKHFRVGTDTTRYCLGSGQIENAIKVVELLAKRYGTLLEDCIAQSATSQNELIVEFICLRIALEWKRRRLDLASHQNQKLKVLMTRLDVCLLPLVLIERWLDVIYEIGTEEQSQHRYRSASTWLRVAKEFFDIAQDTPCYTDLNDMRLNILHAYARSLLEEGNTEATAEALKTIEALKKDYGDKLAVMLLHLETLSKSSHVDINTFFTELMAVVRSVHIIDPNHKLIIFYVHQLHALSHDHALRVLQQYILSRLVHQTNNTWTESAIVTLLWMVTTTQVCDTIHTMSFLDSISDAWKQQLSAEAANASLMLLWKQIDQFSAEEPDQANLWCKIALHRIFTNAGEDHIGKIERRLISCYLSLGNLELAQSNLESMSSIRRAHHLSRYLAYCTYLKLKDENEADSTLSAIVTLPGPDNKLLFACVSETMRHGSKLQSARLLQRLLDKYSNGPPPEVDVSALLRCTARLLIAVVDEPQVDKDEILTRLCYVLKAAVAYSTSDATSRRTSTPTLQHADCQWLEQYSFNHAVKHLKDWPAKYVIDILQYSGQINHPPESTVRDPDRGSKRMKHALAIAYIQAVLYANEARLFEQSWVIEHLPRTSFSSRAKPDTNQIHYTLYKNVLDRYWLLVQAYDIRQQAYTQEETEELHTRMCTVLPLGFEALLHMNSHAYSQETDSTSFDELSLIQIIEKAVKIEAPPKIYGLLADLILCAVSKEPPRRGHRPPQTNNHHHFVMPLTSAMKLLTKIVQSVRNFQIYDMDRAARWIRCIVQLILDDNSTSYNTQTSEWEMTSSTSNTASTLLKPIIDQAIMLARSAAETASNSTQMYQQADHGNDVHMLDSTIKPSHHAGRGIVYPPEELEYLATVLFNMAVDLYVAGNEDEAKWYAGKAVEIADVLALPTFVRDGRTEGGDKGMLAILLREKTGKLGWVL